MESLSNLAALAIVTVIQNKISNCLGLVLTWY